MIHSIVRLGSEQDNDGWFLVNENVEIRYVDDDGRLTAEVKFDSSVITEQEVQELANELIIQVMEQAPFN